MDTTTIFIAIISGSFPTIGLIVNTIVNARSRKKDIQTSTRLDIYKSNMSKRSDAYQSLISTSRDLGSRYTSCLYVFRTINHSEDFNHDGTHYKSLDDFYVRHFIQPYKKYINIEQNNIIYSSKEVYKILVPFNESIRTLNRALATIATSKFQIKEESEEILKKYKSDFDTNQTNLLNKIFEETEELLSGK